MLGNLRGWEWLLIVGLVVVLFGAKRLPEAARGVGRSLRIFKAETKGLRDGSGPAEASGEGETSVPAVTSVPETSVDELNSPLQTSDGTELTRS